MIDKKISVDKPLTLRSITKYDNVLLQFTTASKLRQHVITNYGSLVIPILDNCSDYNLRRLLLQFTTGITIHDRTNSLIWHNQPTDDAKDLY